MTDDPNARRITLVMPSVDNFEFARALAMVRATGARIVGAHRFEVEGPMTVEQATHLLRIQEASFRNGDREGRFQISIDPDAPELTDEELDDAVIWYEKWSPGI